MDQIFILQNKIQEYEWGSHLAIAKLLGLTQPSVKPQAELWLGAHPRAPSQIFYNGKWVSLKEVIEKYPVQILGEKIYRKYGCQLPFLLKVLAAAKPLSIQAHPNQSQALEGFQKENKLKIPLSAFNRNYKDDNHKPECICALTPFWALNGFRKISDIVLLMEKVCPPGLTDILQAFKANQRSAGLKTFFKALMSLNQADRQKLIPQIIQNANGLAENENVFSWMIKLNKQYPNDIGVLSPILLNLVCLKPGQAMFLPAGELHAYLDGLGIELMANSDNVLRGGLTPKHVDIPELMKVLNFSERKIEILTPLQVKTGERVYLTKADEFELSVINLKKGQIFEESGRKGVEILLCVQGEAIIGKQEKMLPVSKGASFLIPSSVVSYKIKALKNTIFYKAKSRNQDISSPKRNKSTPCLSVG